MERSVGERVRAVRTAAGITQAELAKRADVPRSWLALVELGRNEAPRIIYLTKVAHALGIPTGFLIDEDR